MLTSKKIAALQPRQKRYSIAIEKGLTIRVHPTGVKSFLLRIPQNGRTIDITLGQFPAMSLMQARQAARKQLQAYSLTPVAGYTLRDAFVLWCNLKRGRIVSYADEKRRIEFYLMRFIGSRQLDEITAPLVIKTVRPIENAGKRSTLKRILMRLREILDIAVCAGYIEHNPINRVSKVFAPPVTKPMPSVDWRELERVMRVFLRADLRMQNFFLFSLCSMLRPGEVAKLEKSWIDSGTLIIPSSQMKKGREHRVPLTPLMLRLLEREKMFSPHPRNKFVFAGRKPDRHISKQALAKWLHASELRGQLVAHGLRSIARCWLADNGIQFEVAEACLSHAVGDKVYRAYQRSDFFEARRSVMLRWSSFVCECAQSAGLLDDSFGSSSTYLQQSTCAALC
jgi:integrase